MLDDRNDRRSLRRFALLLVLAFILIEDLVHMRFDWSFPEYLSVTRFVWVHVIEDE